MSAGRTLLERLWADGAVTVSPEPITLKSGRVSHVYVSLRHFVCDPDNLRLLVDVFGNWLDNRPARVGTVASLLSPVLAGACAARWELPLVLFRPDRSEKGLPGTVFGRRTGLPIVLIDDVLTSGGTALEAARVLAGYGDSDVSLFVVVDKRPAGLRESFPLPVAAPLTLGELLHYGIAKGHLSGPQEGWAREELAFLEG